MLRRVVMAGLAGLFPFLLHAQSIPLTATDARVDRGKSLVEFEVLNSSSKPIHSWLMNVNLQLKNQAGELSVAGMALTSESCGRIAADLAPGQTRRCSAPLQISALETAPVDAEVRIAAVLYGDGTADGDLALLDSVIRERRIRFQTLRYWRELFHVASKAPTPAAHLKAFTGMLFGPAPTTPSDIFYDSTAMRERKTLQNQLASMTEAQSLRPEEAMVFVTRLAAMFDERIQEASEQSRVFPTPPKPYSQPARTALHPMENLTSGFRVAAAEWERDGTFRLVLRNYYEKEIVEFALSQRGQGEVMLTSKNLRDTAAGRAIAPGTLAEIRIGILQESDPPVEISCVVFRDGTSEGDQEIAWFLNESWAGRTAESAKILPRFAALAEMPEPEMAAGIERLIDDLGAQQQDELDASHSVHFELGVRQQRQAFVRELQQLAGRNSYDGKTELANIIRRMERRLGKN